MTVVRLKGVKRYVSDGKVYHYHRATGTRLPDDPTEAASLAATMIAAARTAGAPKARMSSELPRRYQDRVWAWKMAELARAALVRARKKGRAHEVTGDQLLELLCRQAFRCAVTGVPFRFMAMRRHWRDPFAPSLDRIDSRGGYTLDNVRLVLAAVNVAMGEWGQDVFLQIARAAVAKHPRQDPMPTRPIDKTAARLGMGYVPFLWGCFTLALGLLFGLVAMFVMPQLWGREVDPRDRGDE